jgi:O-antigen/teichoic acid export membrane protein
MEENFISENIQTTSNIINRVIHRDFSGNSGIAIRNSTYLFMTNVVAKFGSLFFTIILAKFLLPIETFGLYSLALSTILLFSVFSDLGVSSAIIRYVSKYENNSKGYIKYLLKLKLSLILFSSFLLLSLSYFVANFYYRKPIFLALIMGLFYLFTIGFLTFISSIFQARNNFKHLFFKEILFQVLRIVIVPITILLLFAYSASIVIACIILTLSFCHLVAFLFLYLKSEKSTGEDISTTQKKEINQFILPLTITALSGFFFGSIDMVMLGRFVEAVNIAHYQAAISLLSSGIIIISFGSVLLPIFSRLKQKSLNSGMKKSILLTIPLSIAGAIFTIIIAPFVIPLVYNSDYLPSILILQSFAILFLIEPLIVIYTNYYLALGKSYFISKVLIVSTAINIVLNYILIKSFLGIYGIEIAVFGAVIATIISKVFYLSLFIIGKKYV